MIPLARAPRRSSSRPPRAGRGSGYLFCRGRGVDAAFERPRRRLESNEMTRKQKRLRPPRRRPGTRLRRRGLLAVRVGRRLRPRDARPRPDGRPVVVVVVDERVGPRPDGRLVVRGRGKLRAALRREEQIQFVRAPLDDVLQPVESGGGPRVQPRRRRPIRQLVVVRAVVCAGDDGLFGRAFERPPGDGLGRCPPGARGVSAKRGKGPSAPTERRGPECPGPRAEKTRCRASAAATRRADGGRAGARRRRSTVARASRRGSTTAGSSRSTAARPPGPARRNAGLSPQPALARPGLAAPALMRRPGSLLSNDALSRPGRREESK